MNGRETRTKIRDMEPGEQGYVVPWAVALTGQTSAMLNGWYTIEPKSGGTVMVWVGKSGSGKLWVDASTIPQEYFVRNHYAVGWHDTEAIAINNSRWRFPDCLRYPEDARCP